MEEKEKREKYEMGRNRAVLFETFYFPVLGW